MKLIILAAGEGTRLKKYTKDLPKGMLSFAGRTVIERQLGVARSCGIDDISIVTGFAREKIDYPGVKYYVNEEYATTNMLVSLFCAESELEGDVIVSYADILYEPGLLKGLTASDGDIVVTVDSDWERYWTKRYGSTTFDTESLMMEDGAIVSLGKEDPDPSEIHGRYVGLIKFSAMGVEKLKATWRKFRDDYWDRPWQLSGKPVRTAYMTDMLQALIDEGYRVDAYLTRNGWLELDTNEDYERALGWAEDGSLSDIFKL